MSRIDFRVSKKSKLNKIQTTALRECTLSPKANPVSIRTCNPDPDDFQNLLELSLSKDTSMIKFSRIWDQLFQRCEPNCAKCPYISLC